MKLFNRLVRTSQPPFGTPPDPYWVSRGLQIVYDGQRVAWSRDAPAVPFRALGGTPKFRNSPKGMVAGIGATYGTGTTNRIDSGTLKSPKSGMRSVVAHLFVNGTGGGGFGRVFQNASGSGIANAGDEAVYLNSSGMLFVRTTSSLSGASYTTTAAFPTGRWATYGYSFLGDYPTNTLPLIAVDGLPITAITINAAAGSAFSANTSMNMSWGNRVSDSARSFDGMIGPVLIFDGYLTPQEHKLLSDNPWRVFAPLGRDLFFAIPTAGGVGNASGNFDAVTITPPTATGAGCAAASGSLASVSIAGPTATASGGAAGNASGSVDSVTLTPPTATATGKASASATPSSVSITPPTATASAGGTGNAFATFMALVLSPATAAATGGASASGLFPAITITGPTAFASGDAPVVGTLDADRFDYARALRIPNAYGPDPAIARMGQRMIRTTRRTRW